jgi:hypothetical protein
MTAFLLLRSEQSWNAIFLAEVSAAGQKKPISIIVSSLWYSTGSMTLSWIRTSSRCQANCFRVWHPATAQAAGDLLSGRAATPEAAW